MAKKIDMERIEMIAEEVVEHMMDSMQEVNEYMDLDEDLREVADKLIFEKLNF